MIEIALMQWLMAQPIHKTDIGEPDRFSRMSQIAEAISVVAGGNKLLAASVAIVMREESGLRRDVQEGRCPPRQCDHGRARGLPQLHWPPAYPRERWIGYAGEGYGPLLLSAIQAANMLRAGRHACGDIGGAFAYYGTGGNCYVYPRAAERARMTIELAGRL